MSGGIGIVTNTTEHTATGELDRMTAQQARYHLRRARQRIASLVAHLDDVRQEKESLRREAARLRGLLSAVAAIASGSGERLD